MLSVPVQRMLADRLGLDVDCLGTAAMEANVAACMRDLGSTNDAEFARRLATDDGAWRRLVDRVTVHETWFSRDRTVFDFVSRLAQADYFEPPRHPVRVLSCPCSTGEEPYSIGIALLEAGLRADQMAIDAVDVSEEAIRRGTAGRFRDRALRDLSLSLRRRYFTPSGDGSFDVRLELRRVVAFWTGNLLDPFAAGLRSRRYRLVFCRNLLIYLHAKARANALAALADVTEEDGTLIVGSAEAGLLREQGWRSIGPAAAFAFHPPAVRTPSVSR